MGKTTITEAREIQIKWNILHYIEDKLEFI